MKGNLSWLDDDGRRDDETQPAASYCAVIFRPFIINTQFLHLEPGVSLV